MIKAIPPDVGIEYLCICLSEFGLSTNPNFGRILIENFVNKSDKNSDINGNIMYGNNF